MNFRRLILIFVVLITLVVYSAVLVIAGNTARGNPVIHKIFNIKEVPGEKIITKVEIVYVEKEVIKEVYWYQFHATGYSSNDPSQGTDRIMSSGEEVYEGAVATDPSVIPIGTKLDICGLPNDWDGIYIAEDVGGAVKDLKIDVFRESKLDALQINQMVWVRILEEE